MKFFKKLATLSMALLFVFGLGALTACGDDASSSSAPANSEQSKTYTCYEFTVLDASGNKVGEGYNVQLCIVKEDGSLGACLSPIAVVNGVCEYVAITEPGVYEAHIMQGYSTVASKEVVRTSATEFGAYTLQLAE